MSSPLHINAEAKKLYKKYSSKTHSGLNLNPAGCFKQFFSLLILFVNGMDIETTIMIPAQLSGAATLEANINFYI